VAALSTVQPVSSPAHGKFLYEQLFAHPYETLQPADSLTRHYICLLFAYKSQCEVWEPTFSLILRTCNFWSSMYLDLIQDLETGAIASWLKLEPEIRARLERRWSANRTCCEN